MNLWVANKPGVWVGCWILSAFAYFSSAKASLIEINPQNYTFSRPTVNGSYNYGDQTGRQLIDGAYGTASIGANLGNGPAYEWIAWTATPSAKTVNIDFNFGSLAQINRIDVGSLQDRPGNVVLPNVYVYQSVNGTTWSAVAQLVTPVSTINNGKHFELQLNDLSIDAPYVRVTIENNVTNWAFVDEVDFWKDSSKVVQSVPESGTTASMVAGSMALLFFLRGRFKA